MRRSIVYFILMFLGLSLLLPVSTKAAEPDVWLEEFKEPNLFNPEQTDVYIYTHPEGGYAELPAKTPAGVIALKENDHDQVVVSSAGLEYFMFTGEETVKNPNLSYPINATSVAVKQDSYSVWVATDKEVYKLEYDGSGMIENPFLKVSGKSNILSIASQPSTDELALLIRDYTGGGLIEYYGSTGESMEKILSFNVSSDWGSPVDIAVIPETMDIVYVTDRAVLYFNFEGSGYIQNPLLSVTGLSDIRALSAHEGGFSVLRAGRKEHYLFTGEDMAYVEGISLTLPQETVSIALKPGTYDFAAIEKDGRIRYYNFVGNGYVENPYLSGQAAPLTLGYYTPRKYVSKPIVFTKGRLVFALDTEAEMPEGTNIAYRLISGTETWELIPGEALVLDEPISSAILEIELSTEKTDATPRITRIELRAFDITLKELKMDLFPLHPDLEGIRQPFSIYPELPADFPQEYLASQSALLLPIPVQKGGAVVFDATTIGNVDTLVAVLEVRENAVNYYTHYLVFDRMVENRWFAHFTVPEDVPDGTEYHLHYMELGYSDGTIELPSEGYMHKPFLLVGDYPEMNLLNYFKVRLTR